MAATHLAVASSNPEKCHWKNATGQNVTDNMPQMKCHRIKCHPENMPWDKI